jgi:asparagine synthase (glutamine-hydrolysing)
MCGILGAFGGFEQKSFSKHIATVDEELRRRGPDQRNLIDLEKFLAVHSRLIVQGNSEDGIQPMRYKNLVVLFNGNLYNTEILKSELQSHGFKFFGVSDTEVVASSIYHWGNEAFKKFNGFFSIACFNIDDRKLTLARDRLGQKPLYYIHKYDSIFFGSTENILPKKFWGGIRKESFLDFITYGYIPAPRTMFNNILSVKAGSYLEFSIRDNQVVLNHDSCYWKPSLTNEISNIDQAVESISNSINQSIQEGMNASIDVACLFSGGIDSSLILAKARSVNKNIFAFTADFGLEDDAEERSRALAEFLGHQDHLIKRISNQDVSDSISMNAQICGSPFDDTSIIPSNLIFSSIKESGFSVALTGDGADELFCGYSSFANLKKLEMFLDSGFDIIRSFGLFSNKLISKYSKFDLERFFMSENDLLADLSCNGFKKREWESVISTEYDPLHYIKDALEELSGYSPLDKFRLLNLRFKLPYQMLYKVDRASMFNSVEARPLFLNNRIVETALSITSNVMLQNGQKSILKRIYQNEIGYSGWNLPKSGFGWKTRSYEDIFNEEDNRYLASATNIDGFSLLKNRKRHHKRGYYGLNSLVTWLKEYA